MWRIGIALTVLAGSAVADDAVRRIEVTVDATTETAVGTSIGFACDDPTLIDGSMKTVDDHNVFVVKGVVAGRTLCRVGTDPQRPSVLFTVVVTDKPPPPKRR